MENEKPEALPAAPVPEKEKGLLDNLFTLDGLPKVFQIVLGASSLFYVTGYLVWALYAWWNELGFLSPIREQYFIAGAIPLLIVVFILGTIKGHLGINKWLVANVHSGSKAYKVLDILSTIGLIVEVLSIVSIVILGRLKMLEYVKIPFYILIGTVVLLYPSAVLGKAGGSGNKFLVYFLFPTFFIYLYIILIIFYVFAFFPTIPREFGGPKKERVRIDIKRADISLTTLAILTPNGARDTTAVIRTKPVYLVFDQGDFMLFSYDDTILNTLKIKREAIMGIYNCAECEK